MIHVVYIDTLLCQLRSLVCVIWQPGSEDTCMLSEMAKRINPSSGQASLQAYFSKRVELSEGMFSIFDSSK